MQIIIRHDFATNTENILNILYGEDLEYTQKWINTYINNEIESLKMTPNNNPLIKIDTIIYIVENNVVVKNYKKIKEGYIYNATQKYSDKLFSIRFLNFDESVSQINGEESFLSNISKNIEINALKESIVCEINHRVLKQLDQPSLYQIFLKFEAAIKTKAHWSSTELINLESESIKSFKKQLYSNIAKRLKRYGKKSHESLPSCRLEWSLIEKKTN